MFVVCDAPAKFFRGEEGTWKRDFGWSDRLLKPQDCRGVTVEEQHITKLNMPDNRLLRTVPPSIANLDRAASLPARAAGERAR